MSWQPPALSAADRARLAASWVAVIGVGGLGSHVALMLARTGVGGLVLADPDRVAPGNLSRQAYFPDQVGLLKVDALRAHLQRLRPEMAIATIPRRLEPQEMGALARQCPVVVEAVDGAQDKAALVEAALAAGCVVVSASGIGGVGRPLPVRRLGRLVVVGDETTPCAGPTPPVAPRVVAAAALQADAVVQWILTREDGR